MCCQNSKMKFSFGYKFDISFSFSFCHSWDEQAYNMNLRIFKEDQIRNLQIKKHLRFIDTGES